MTLKEYFYYILLLIFLPRSLKTMEWRMLRLLNKDRKKHGLLPVKMQDDLREVARKHSKDMAQKDYFDHVNQRFQTPSDRLKLAGISDVVSGENLAKIGGYPNATQFAEEGLMNSPGHRANILNALYNAVGIGVIQSQTKIYYFTQNFAKRELLFKKSLLKNVSLKKGLKIEGVAFSHIKKIYYEVHLPGKDSALTSNVVSFQDKNFSFVIHFPERGLYEVFLYVEKSDKPGNFTLANKFQIKVVKSFWENVLG